MPKQLLLGGFDAVPHPTERLFFAVYPDMATAARIERLAQYLRGKHRLQGNPLVTAHFHVTLHFLGDYISLPRDIIAAAAEAAATVFIPPFEIAFDRASSFRRPSNLPFVLRGRDGVMALMEFHRTLGMAMTRVGLGRCVKADYTPHVTLLYDDRCVAEESVETIAWTVREFVLVNSLIGRKQHVPLLRWPLRG